MQPLDVLIVLGCRVSPLGSPVGASLRRVEHCSRLFQQGFASHIITSGGVRWSGQREADCFADALVARGIDRSVISLETRSRNTFENARFCADLIANLGASRVGIVTCDWHCPRAVELFQQLQINPIALPCHTPHSALPLAVARLFREQVASLMDSHRKKNNR